MKTFKADGWPLEIKLLLLFILIWIWAWFSSCSTTRHGVKYYKDKDYGWVTKEQKQYLKGK